MTRTILRVSVSVAAIVVTATAARADVSLPSVISDHMVLQRESEAPIWGWARAGEHVRVEASWKAKAETVADDRGRWIVRLPTPTPGGPHVITVTGETAITLDDVLVGEVWVCSGQSNMEWPVSRADDAETEIAAADHPRIRLFTVPNVPSAMPRADCRGAWRVCSPETVRSFSAVGYFFGRALQERLDVPIGLVSADWGGTVVEAWTSAERLADFPEFADTLSFLADMTNPDARVGVVEKRVEEWWGKLGAGAVGEAWMTPEFDDARWRTMQLPVTMKKDGLDTFDGVVCFRREVDLPEAWADEPGLLELGPIDDYDDTWINGVHVGATHAPGQWQQPRAYRVPAGVLRAGRNVIAVRVLDTGGLGGLNGSPEQMVLRSAGGTPVTLAGDWRWARGPSMGEMPTRPQGPEIGRNMPSVLYNGQIAPLVPYAIRGAIWYQGESNRTRPLQYRALFPAMIGDWRAHWGQGDFPFYYVQIAPFAYGGDTGEAALLREAQAVAMREPNTGMVVTLDIGDPRDIHPTNKQEVGRRLALWALARTYGEANLAHTGPVYRKASAHGGAMRVHFDHLGGGLELRETAKPRFFVAGADRRFMAARPRIEGDTLLVSSADVPNPVAVRYAWEAAPDASLFNRDGLPAPPFRSDDW